jgi:hypothetical protein
MTRIVPIPAALRDLSQAPFCENSVSLTALLLSFREETRAMIKILT